MKNCEIKNEKRMTKASIESGMTLAAQLKAVWHDHQKGLVAINKDGEVTNLNLTKVEHVSSLGMDPHYIYSKDGKIRACTGYTPAEFNKNLCDELLEKDDKGSVKATYVYRERVVSVTIFEDGEEGSRNYSLYTKEEADKKAMGEPGAKSIRVYRKCMIDKYGWSQRLIFDVLTQNKYIEHNLERARKSKEEWEAIDKVYIVQNIGGHNYVTEVEKPVLDF